MHPDLNPAMVGPSRPAHPRPARSFRPLVVRARRGFALIVTLSMMTLLLLLVLTLTTLVRINVDAANSNLATAQARQNALLAAYIGIGQLQKFAGPDQRATTTAYLGLGGEGPDPADPTAEMNPALSQIFGQQTGSPNLTNGQTLNTDTPLTAPYGATGGLGGTWYWTGVWGPGVNPLALYTGLGTKYDGTTTGNAPDPILLNWLVSGDEGTPLTFNFYTNNPSSRADGTVAPPPGTANATTLAYTPETGGNIGSLSEPSAYNWTALTNDITITPKNLPTGLQGDQPAALLVGPNTAYTGSGNSYTLSTTQTGTVVFRNPRSVNVIVAPIVTINNITPAGAPAFTSGRYAFWVGDEGVKAKLTPVDPYVASNQVQLSGDAGQLARYRFWAPMRSAIERMLGMSSYGNINGSTPATATAGALLKRMLEPSQIYFADPKLQGIDSTGLQADVSHPEESVMQHYFDFTTYSYGLLTDSLRGGLRYDLTTAFTETSKNNQNPVFKDTTNGLLNRAILPGVVTNASPLTTTEPNVVAGSTVHGVQLNAPVGPGGSATVIFHGPNAPPPPGATNAAVGGLRWDAIENFYNIAANSNNGTGAPNGQNAVPVQAGSTIKAGITPLITQFRLRFGEFADSNEEQYVSIEPEFVLANPYSFPITDAGGGMDLGFRINTSTIPPGYTTGWEWSGGLAARNDIRQAPTASGETMALGYDQTQTVGVPAANFDFKSSSAGSSQPNPGYYPFLKDTIDYPSGLSTSQGGYNSALDNIAFHIHGGLNSTFAPGEAKVFSLAPNAVTKTVNLTYYTASEGIVTAWVGSPLTGTGSGTSSIAPGDIAVVPIIPQQPIYNPALTLPAPFYFLRDTGISTAPGKYVQLNSGAMNPAMPVAPFTAADAQWPGLTYGYFSTLYPAPAFTIELRSDITEPTPAPAGAATPQQPYKISSPYYTVSTGIAGPGQNVLTSIENMDLTGDGLIAGVSSPVQPDPRGYVPPFSLAEGFRRQYLGTGQPGGSMPVFLSSYMNMIALPGNLGDGPTQQTLSPHASNMLGFYVNYKGQGTIGSPQEGWFDPSQYLAYRVYTDFNLRATNMALPPFASFNNPWGGGTATAPVTTPQYSPPGSYNNITAYMTTPPYGRVFDEGPSPDDSVPTGQEDVTFSQNSLGSNGLTGAGFSSGGTNSASDDAAWGYSNSKNNQHPGEQFVTLYGLPVKGPSATEQVGTSGVVPDVPMMSLGQLTQADFTEDDVWCSIGYQPGHAFGNSYFTPYVTRGSVMQAHKNLSAKAVLLTVVTTDPKTYSATYLGGSGTNPPFAAIDNAYDISYLMNVALWDRYFFSTLVPAVSPTPANPRMAFAAGYSPATVVANMQNNAAGPNTTTDPATSLPTFVAYAPARFLMINGAFNINSTSFEAWRAVLSALRGVAFSNGSGVSTGANAGQTVSYFPRAMTSPALSNETSGGTQVNMAVNDATSNANAGLNDPPSYAGFRQLTDDQIDILAAKIIQQVHQRGPFLSLAQFVNRNLQYQYTGGTAESHLIYTVSGPLQAAIDMSTGQGFPSFNSFFGNATADTTVGLFLPGNTTSNTTASTTGIYPDAPLLVKGSQSSPYSLYNNPVPSANPNSVLTGIPGWLTQADLLQTLAPILAARSDTFTIRTYGEQLNPSVNQVNLTLPPSNTENPITNDPSAVQARAWCEVVVQRMPDYIATDKNSMNDPSATTGYNAPNPNNPSGKASGLSPVNAYFGRRFKIVSIKWLTADDI